MLAAGAIHASLAAQRATVGEAATARGAAALDAALPSPGPSRKDAHAAAAALHPLGPAWCGGGGSGGGRKRGAAAAALFGSSMSLSKSKSREDRVSPTSTLEGLNALDIGDGGGGKAWPAPCGSGGNGGGGSCGGCGDDDSDPQFAATQPTDGERAAARRRVAGSAR